MDPKKTLVSFEKLSEKKQNELIIKQLENDKIGNSEVNKILGGLNLEGNIYDVLADMSIGDFFTTKLSSAQKKTVYDALILLNKYSDITVTKNDQKKTDNPKPSFDSLLLKYPNSKYFQDAKTYLDVADGTKNPIDGVSGMVVNPNTKKTLKALSKYISLDENQDIMLFGESLKTNREDKPTKRDKKNPDNTKYSIHGKSYTYGDIKSDPAKAKEIFRKTEMIAKLNQLRKDTTGKYAISGITDFANPIQGDLSKFSVEKEFIDILYILGIRNNWIDIYTDGKVCAFVDSYDRDRGSNRYSYVGLCS